MNRLTSRLFSLTTGPFDNATGVVEVQDASTVSLPGIATIKLITLDGIGDPGQLGDFDQNTDYAFESR